MKENGYKVGALKFKSVCNSVDLKQYHVTYEIDKDRSRVRIQNIRKPFRVRGLEQIPENAETANAKFIRKASGLYFHITCYVPKEEKILPAKSVGIDFGIGDNLVFSDGRAPVNICVPESKGTKLASRRMNKALSHNGNKKVKTISGAGRNCARHMRKIRTKGKISQTRQFTRSEAIMTLSPSRMR